MTEQLERLKSEKDSLKRNLRILKNRHYFDLFKTFRDDNDLFVENPMVCLSFFVFISIMFVISIIICSLLFIINFTITGIIVSVFYLLCWIFIIWSLGRPRKYRKEKRISDKILIKDLKKDIKRIEKELATYHYES